jgi:hypothetical protein
MGGRIILPCQQSTRQRCMRLGAALWLLTAITCSAFAQATPQPIDPRQSGRLSPDLEEILGWLPEDTESLMVARGRYQPLPIPPAGQTGRIALETQMVDGQPVQVFRNMTTGQLVPDPAPFNDERFMRRAIEVSGLGHFEALGSAFMTHIAEQPLRLTVSASRRFGPVTGIPGGSPYEGCRILVFDRAIPEGRVTIAERAQATNFEVGLRTVLTLKTREDWGDNKKLTLYFCHAEPHVLIAATNEQFLMTALDRMDRPGKSRAFPPELDEWKHLRTDVPLWGIRHGVDKTSPAAKPLTRELTYFRDSQPGREMVVRFRSGKYLPDATLASLVNELGGANGKDVKARRLPDNAVELRLPTDNYDVLLAVYVLMGHVVLL